MIERYLESQLIPMASKLKRKRVLAFIKMFLRMSRGISPAADVPAKQTNPIILALTAYIALR
jgi:hypothetical protein